jgi:RHS repeat-associated protein
MPSIHFLSRHLLTVCSTLLASHQVGPTNRIRNGGRVLALCIACVLLSFTPEVDAQQLGDADNNLPPFGAYGGSDFDLVSIQNGNLHIRIPILNIKQRGGNFPINFVYDTPTFAKTVTVITYPGHRVYATNYTWQYGWGWRLIQPANWGLHFFNSTATCSGQSGNPVNVNWSVVDPEGASHPVYLKTSPSSLCSSSQIFKNATTDSTGIMVDISQTPNVLTLKDGTRITLGNPQVATDPNGNLISGWTDNLNRTLLTTTTGPSTNYTSPLGKTGSGPSYTLWTTTDANGAQQNYRVDYTFIDVQGPSCPPNTAVTTCSTVSGGSLVPAKLTLPSGAYYQFSWLNNDMGELQQITLPTGGAISYSYNYYCSAPPPNTSGTTSSSTCRAGVIQRSVSVGANTYTWNYPGVHSGSGGTFTETDPNGNDTLHTLSYFSNSSCASPNTVETKVAYYSGSSSTGTLLKTIATDYTGNVSPDGTSNCTNLRPIRVTTTLDNGLVSKVETDYDITAYMVGGVVSPASNLNISERRFYAYGSGAPGALLKKIDYTYLHSSNSAYLPLNIIDRVIFTKTYDGNGTLVSQSQNEYDNYIAGLQASGAVQHDAAFGTSFLTRGNTTALMQWKNADGSWLTTRRQYDDAGNILSSTDPLGHTTQFDYMDSWISIAGTAGGSACAPSGQGKAYPTKVTNALNQITIHSYYSCTGALGSATDPNSLTSWNVYDLFGRTVQAHAPDGGVTTNCFTDTGGTGCQQTAPPFQRVTTKTINPSVNEVTTAVFDGLDRLTQTQLNSDPQGTAYTDTTYDLLSRVSTVSNPYRAGSDPTSSPGTTTYTYDAIGRKTAVTYPDGSIQKTAYCGNSTLATDPTGRWRRSLTDALGRLVEVDEPNAVGATVAATGCPGTGEPIWITSYGYDTLGNLTSVLQNASHQRTFTYDSLSRLLTSTNPETGTITYTYNADGTLATKKDARNITTTYNYDSLRREKTITYSNGDPSIAINYDESNCLGLTACQNIGQRTSATDGAGSEAWSYQVDAANKRTVHVNQRTNISTPSNITKTSTYYLDLAGNLTSVVYPTGRVLNYTFDAADRPSSAVDGSNGITYAAGFDVSPGGTCLADVTCYTPQGTFYALSIGETSSFTGLNLTHIYNNRLQPQEFKASSTGGNAIDITYNFVDPVSGGNAGHVYSITNNLDTTRSQAFTYDQLNRISSALTTSTHATSPAHCWGESFTLDPWGNLQSIAATTNSAYTGCSLESGFSSTADANNHLPAWAYDASGNATSDGTYAYAWDAESQLKSAAGVTYAYDGDGRRVSKSNGKLYWYGSGGEILAETNAAGTTTAEYIFFGGKRIAMLPAGGNPIYYVEDLLGTSRVLSANTGIVCYDADFYPYGGERSYTNTCPQNNYKFEGKQRDTETGNDDFGARYYSNRFGRWLSADWSAVPAPVPYANLTNPQTLNLYAMVADDPESFADLDGHVPDPQNGTPQTPANCPSDGLSVSSASNCTGSSPSASNLQAQHAENQAAQQPADDVARMLQAHNNAIQNAKADQFTTQDMAQTLQHAGQMGDAGVKAGLAVVGAEAAVATGVVAAPTVAATVNTATTSAYVQATTALSAAGTAIANGARATYNTVINTAQAAQAATYRAAVWVDTLKSGGGAFNAASNFVQGYNAATSAAPRQPPPNNTAGGAGFVVGLFKRFIAP